jgi:hypothetical protein
MVDVGTHTQCSGPYDGLHDMLGNAREWIDSCTRDGTTEMRDGCTALGGEDVRGEASCWDRNELSRYWTSDDLGFRCCGL